MAAAEGGSLETNPLTIFEASKICEALFEESLQLPDIFQNKWALNQSASFRLWVESIGAFARWSASADARLQHNENMKAAIMGLLDVLQLSLRQTIEAYKDPAFVQSVFDEQSQQSHDSLGKELSYLEPDDDSDDETEAESTTLAHSKQVSSPQVSDRDEDDSINLTNSDGDSSTGSQFRPDHEVESVLIRLHQLLLTIRSSRRFDWRERASRFIYPGSEDFRKHMEWYINERFRHEYPEVSEFIWERLLRANIKRRNQFEYAREHALKLAEDKTRSTSGRDVSGTAAPQGEEGGDMPMDAPSHEDVPSSRPDAPSKVISKSVPSTQATDYAGASLERSEVGTASISSGKTFKDGQLPWPSPPKAPYINPALPSFPCPYCRSPLPIEYSTGRDFKKKWRQHVKNDIQPYVCLFEECPTPLKLYSRSADWVNHMRNAHGETQYACFAPKHEHNRVYFRTPESYISHLMQAHAKTFVGSEYQDLVVRSRCKIPLDPIFYVCPICPGPEMQSVLEKRKESVLEKRKQSVLEKRKQPVLEKRKQPESPLSLPHSPTKRAKVDETLTSRMQAVRMDNSAAADKDNEDNNDDDDEDDEDDEDGGIRHKHSDEARLLRHIMEHLQYIALMALPWAENLGSARSSTVSVGQALDHSNDNVVPEDHEGPVDVEAEEQPNDPTYPAEPVATPEWGFINSSEARREDERPNKQGFYRRDYTIAWICSQPLDLRVATAALDTIHHNFARNPFDPNDYVLGTVGRWSIVIARHDPEVSKGPLIVDLSYAFPKIKLFVSVGVSGAIPWREVFLGDVVVTTNGPEFPSETFEFNKELYLKIGPPSVQIIPATEYLEDVDMRSVLSSFQQEKSTLAKFAVYPGLERDLVFDIGYQHVGNHPNCDFCDPSEQIQSKEKPKTSPQVHIGDIPFTTRSVTDLRSQRLQQPWDLDSAIDGSAQDLYTTLTAQPKLIVRGISDYADSHKPVFWKNYASTTAGAFVKALLLQLTNIEIEMGRAWLKLGGLRPPPARPRGRQQFKIAIVCESPLAAGAVYSIFDQHWNRESYEGKPGDVTEYVTGAMRGHNVVLVDTNGRSAVDPAHFQMSYPGIEFIFLVGTCGAAPTANGREVALGDVFISTGVAEVTFGKNYPVVLEMGYPGSFLDLGSPDGPDKTSLADIGTIMSQLEKTHFRRRVEARMNGYLQERQGQGSAYAYPGSKLDRLFGPSYLHKHHSAVTSPPCAVCNGYETSICEEAESASCENLGCEDTALVERARFKTAKNSDDVDDGHTPRVHFSEIAFVDYFPKSGEDRDRISSHLRTCAFSVVGEGFLRAWDGAPRIMINGACDYADGHKNEHFQPYAAASAAACTKAILDAVPPW